MSVARLPCPSSPPAPPSPPQPHPGQPQLRFLDGLDRLSENLPLAESLEPNQELKPYIIHSWLSDIPDLGKTLQLQAATPCLWTANKDPKNKYLYDIFYINHIILITHKLFYQ